MESDGKLRMLRILELLRNETDEQHPLSTAQIERILRERWGLEAYRITIQKDIAALVAAGYEIETIRSTQNKYYFSGRLFEKNQKRFPRDVIFPFQNIQLINQLFVFGLFALLLLSK